MHLLYVARLLGSRKSFAARARRHRAGTCLALGLATALAADAGSPASAQSVDTGSRTFTTLVSAMCGNGWGDLRRLSEMGMIDDAYLRKALPSAEKQCNAVYSAGQPNGIGGFLISKYGSLSADDVSWATGLQISNGSYFGGARLVARVPRVFALADYYARAETLNDPWAPASLIEVTNNWLAKGGDVNMRSCHGFKLADLLVASGSAKTLEIIKNAGADFNYRTPFTLANGNLAYNAQHHQAGSLYEVNFRKYGVYYYGANHPSFAVSSVNRCVTDAELERTGIPFVEYLIRNMTHGSRYRKQTMLGVLKSVIGGIRLPQDIVHAIPYRDNFPSNGLEILDVLTARGADINARNADGLTLIDRVFNAGGNPDLLKELTRRGAKL